MEKRPMIELLSAVSLEWRLGSMHGSMACLLAVRRMENNSRTGARDGSHSGLAMCFRTPQQLTWFPSVKRSLDSSAKDIGRVVKAGRIPTRHLPYFHN